MSSTETRPSPAAKIHPRELARMRAEDPAVHVIDVRTPGEFEAGHIEGSYNVPLDLLVEHVPELTALDRDVVLVCQSGGRATRALDPLAAAGKSNLRLLEGGINAWMALGGSLSRTSRRRWAMERQVRLVAGGAVVVSLVASLWFPPVRLLAAMVGAGLAFSAVTDTCGMATVLAKLPYNRSVSCDIGGVLDRMATADAARREGGA
jgi:rhodanese-related sulfurtransferase